MNTLHYIKTSLTVVLLFPLSIHAQCAGGTCSSFNQFASGLRDFVGNFLVPLMVAICVLAFVYGVFMYFIKGSAEEDARTKGRSFMVYALIGFVAIVALWGIVNFLASGFGFDAGGTAPGLPSV